MTVVSDHGLEVLRKSADVVTPTEYRLRTTGTAQFTGLSVGGLITEVTINSSTWTALPATPLANRNAISIQNYSGTEIKINYSSGVSGYVGVIMKNNSERQYDITDDIILYAKSSSGSVTVIVEEIA